MFFNGDLGRSLECRQTLFMWRCISAQHQDGSHLLVAYDSTTYGRDLLFRVRHVHHCESICLQHTTFLTNLCLVPWYFSTTHSEDLTMCKTPRWPLCHDQKTKVFQKRHLASLNRGWVVHVSEYHILDLVQHKIVSVSKSERGLAWYTRPC